MKIIPRNNQAWQGGVKKFLIREKYKTRDKLFRNFPPLCDMEVHLAERKVASHSALFLIEFS